MKMTWRCIILFICLCLGQLYAQTYNNIRVAYFGLDPDSSIPNRFYERARANGFNYILAEFQLQDPAWVGGRYYGNVNSRLRKQLKQEFLAADQNGLKLIPLFQTSDIHSGHWDEVRNDSIQWQTLPDTVPHWIPVSKWTWAKKKVPTFAPDPSGVFGFDSSFNQLLNVIYTAFADARSSSPPLSYSNLDYIHIGADEPIIDFEFNGTYKVLVMAGMCPRDRTWLTSVGLGQGSSSQAQVIALLASNIKRKVQMIRAAGLNRGHTTTALYYADMLDPNLLGGGHKDLCAFSNVFNTTSLATTGIKTYSMSGSQYIQDIRDLSIAVQWNYEREYALKDYDTDSTFRYFKSKGLKFLHGNALAGENLPISGDWLHQFMEQAVVGAKPEYNNYVRGFVSFHWCSGANVFNNAGGWYNQAPAYMTMEFLSHILWHNAALYD